MTKLLRFWIPPAVVPWKENIWCVFRMKLPFSNFPGIVWNFVIGFSKTLKSALKTLRIWWLLRFQISPVKSGQRTFDTFPESRANLANNFDFKCRSKYGNCSVEIFISPLSIEICFYTFFPQLSDKFLLIQWNSFNLLHLFSCSWLSQSLMRQKLSQLLGFSLSQQNSL